MRRAEFVKAGTDLGKCSVCARRTNADFSRRSVLIESSLDPKVPVRRGTARTTRHQDDNMHRRSRNHSKLECRTRRLPTVPM